MAIIKLASCLTAVAALAVAYNAGAVGLPDVSNAHAGKQLKEVNSINDALKGGKADVWLRLRYENVSDKIPAGSPLAGTGKANLLTLRTALGYSTARAHGFYARVEFEANTIIGDENALTLGEDLTFPPGPAGSRIAKGYSIIPDDAFAQFNEAYVGWRSATSDCKNAPEGCNGATTVKAGRQEIIYNNHRWVGNIVWRQNFQTYDSFRIDNTSLNNLSVSYSYIDRVKRTFGPDSPFNAWDMENTHLINAAYKFPIGKLTGYGYLLDFKDNPRTPFPEGVGAVGTPGIANFDSDTWGARFTGKYKTSDAFSLLYQLEFANQKPVKDAGPTLSDNNYYLFEIGGAFKLGGKPTAIKIGQEVLGGNGVNALQTPFATIHGFNGWADKFVGAAGGTATPVGGLEDTSVTLVVKGLIGKSKLVVTYHDFKANKVVKGLKNYGNEWDLLFAKPFTKEWLGLIKYAGFNDGGDGFSFDTDKYWVMAQYRFK